MTDRSTEEIQEAVRQKYAEVSRSVAGKFRYLTGKALHPLRRVIVECCGSAGHDQAASLG
jgi:hypothetical protein